MRARSLLVTIVAMLPASEVKNRVLRRLGWTVGAGVHISPCIVVDVDQVDFAEGVHVGPFNVLRDLSSVTLGSHAQIGQWNWITAARSLREVGGPASLYLGAHSAITSRHYVDTTGGIRIGRYTTIAGVRSTLFTHGISWRRSAQTFRPIEIGDYCLISSNVQVAAGSIVGDKVVVGMGATISGELGAPGLYVQSRAKLVKSDLDGRYFCRDEGFVGTP